MSRLHADGEDTMEEQFEHIEKLQDRGVFLARLNQGCATAPFIFGGLVVLGLCALGCLFITR